jgi:hypothetical protein
MKFRAFKPGFLRGLLAFAVSLAVLISSQAFVFAGLNNSNSRSSSPQNDDEFFSASAFVTDAGVRLEWTSKFDLENLGFNIYRVQNGQRVRINREIIPGAVFAASEPDPRLRLGSSSYGWIDSQGTVGAVYYIESVSVAGESRFHAAVPPVWEKPETGTKQFPRTSGVQSPALEISSGGDSALHEVGYPAASALGEPQQMSASTLADQWAIAAQTAVKIAIKKDGWYRITQPQMAAVGFTPTVDIQNLQLFVDGQEVAISTSQSSGLFGPSDYIEFFGRGVDVPSSDIHTYYLVASASPGKRIRGEMQIDSPPANMPPLPHSPAPQATPPPTLPNPSSAPSGPKAAWSEWRWSNVVILSGPPVGVPFFPAIIGRGEATKNSAPRKELRPEENAVEPATLSPAIFAEPSGKLTVAASTLSPEVKLPVSRESKARANSQAAATPAEEPPIIRSKNVARRTSRNRKKKGRLKDGLSRRASAAAKREYSHAVVAGSAARSDFSYTVERRERTIYFSALINGQTENFFGQVISASPVSQTISTPNPAFSAAGPARLEIKLQGVTEVAHNVSVKFNGVAIGSLNSFFFHENEVKTFDIPLSLLQNGANTIGFATAAGGDTSIVDYTRITYPHTFRADSDALKFSLLGTQTNQVDGFSNQNVLLIDYTDPLNVGVVSPEFVSTSNGFAITVPTSTPKTKDQRLLYATAGPAEQPFSISLNQPSTLNLNTNAADFLIVTTSGLRASLAPLVTARQAQGMSVAVVDVEDVYDEFGYGLHGPQALKDFLARAGGVWAGKPKYIVLAGDASYDPRNYLGSGNFDLVPTRLVDATYNETASDDWLADFDDDGIADIPVGRLPVRTPAEAGVVVGKIVNFAPVAPESALLVADDPTGYYFNFEHANDLVQAQLPASMSVQRVNIRTDGPATAKANVIAGFNQGRALVNYTGHGNVDVWSGAAIFKTADALTLTNSNKLSFVIVMDCLNGFFQAPVLVSLSEGFLKAPGGGAVAAFASSGLTLPDGQHSMSTELYSLIYGAQPIALGDAIKIAKGATDDIDVRRTWIFFGDPSMKIR